MECFTHARVPAVGVCAVCQKAVCRECIGTHAPRLVCRTCAARGIIGFEYRSAAAIGNLPLVHVCTGVDPVTLRPRVAKGIVAIGNIAMGAIAFGGLSLGLVTFGGVSVGILAALGGVAAGAGMSVGGLAIGFSYAAGGLALGPAVIDARHCDEAARQLLLRWLGPSSLPPACR